LAFGGNLQRLSQKAGGQLSYALPRAGGAKRLHERGQAGAGSEGSGKKEGKDGGMISLLVLMAALVYLNAVVEEKNAEAQKGDKDDEV
jgi:hypothetical protein